MGAAKATTEERAFGSRARLSSLGLFPPHPNGEWRVKRLGKRRWLWEPDAFLHFVKVFQVALLKREKDKSLGKDIENFYKCFRWRC